MWCRCPEGTRLLTHAHGPANTTRPSKLHTLNPGQTLRGPPDRNNHFFHLLRGFGRTAQTAARDCVLRDTCPKWVARTEPVLGLRSLVRITLCSVFHHRRFLKPPPAPCGLSWWAIPYVVQGPGCLGYTSRGLLGFIRILFAERLRQLHEIAYYATPAPSGSPGQSRYSG